MALNAAILSTEMTNKLMEKLGLSEQPHDMKAVTDAISEAVVNHIKTNAVVTVTGIAPTGGGTVVSTGSPAAIPPTGGIA